MKLPYLLTFMIYCGNSTRKKSSYISNQVFLRHSFILSTNLSSSVKTIKLCHKTENCISVFFLCFYCILVW